MIRLNKIPFCNNLKEHKQKKTLQISVIYFILSIGKILILFINITENKEKIKILTFLILQTGRQQVFIFFVHLLEKREILIFLIYYTEKTYIDIFHTPVTLMKKKILICLIHYTDQIHILIYFLYTILRNDIYSFFHSHQCNLR